MILPQKACGDPVEPVEFFSRCGRSVEQDGQGVGADSWAVDPRATERGDGLGKQGTSLFGPSPLVAPVVVSLPGEGQKRHAERVTCAP